MFTIAHGLHSTRLDEIKDEYPVNISRKSKDRGFHHRLILTDSDDELIQDLPGDLDVFCPESEQIFSELYRLYRESDVAHLHTFNQNPLHRLPAYLAGVPIIDHPKIAIAIPNVDRVQSIICETESLASIQKAPGRIEHIPAGIKLDGEPPCYQSFEQGDPLHLLELSDSESEHSYTAEDFMPTLHQRFPAVECHIIGREGENRQGMVYHGEVNDPRPYFRRAQFLVQFMENQVPDQSVLRAYHQGVIPVVSGGNQVREQVDHTETGFFMESPNKGEVIQQLQVIIEQYQDDPSFWIPMVENGFRLLKQRFSKQKQDSGYHSLYETVASKPVEDFQEISWSSVFNRFFRRVTSEGACGSREKPKMDVYPHPLERDLIRLTYLQSQQTLSASRAIEWLEAVETDQMNQHYEILRERAQLHQQSGNQQAARRYAEKAIEKEPDLPEPYFIVADCMLNNGSIREALDLLLEFQQQYPDYKPMNEMIEQINQI